MTQIIKQGESAFQGQVDEETPFVAVSNEADPKTWHSFALALHACGDGELPVLDFTALDYELAEELKKHAFARNKYGDFTQVKLLDGETVYKHDVWIEVAKFLDDGRATEVRNFLEALAVLRDDVASFAASHATALEWCAAEDAAKNAEVKTS